MKFRSSMFKINGYLFIQKIIQTWRFDRPAIIVFHHQVYCSKQHFLIQYLIRRNFGEEKIWRIGDLGLKSPNLILFFDRQIKSSPNLIFSFIANFNKIKIDLFLPEKIHG